MASTEFPRRLIVNADGFGCSHAINQAVLQAHREGILTSASLMVNGRAFDEAVELARAHPRLGVGLHLGLVCGHSTLAPSAIPGLVFLNKGLKELGQREPLAAAPTLRVIKSGAANPNLLLGVLFEAIFFAGILVLMSRADVSFIWPLTSLGFVLTTLAARFILKEDVSLVRRRDDHVWRGVHHLE